MVATRDKFSAALTTATQDGKNLLVTLYDGSVFRVLHPVLVGDTTVEFPKSSTKSAERVTLEWSNILSIKITHPTLLATFDDH